MISPLRPNAYPEAPDGLWEGHAVKISAKSMRQVFHGCEVGYIRDVCKAACCRSSTSPTGTRIALLPAEAVRETARGLTVLNGELQPRQGQHRCPHQGDTGLCGLHSTGDKPFGCIASPFILSKRDTLIVRNRYRLLRCYRDGDVPAYRAFATSLALLFGTVLADQITAHLDGGGGDLVVQMPDYPYQALRSLSDHGGRDAIQEQGAGAVHVREAPEDREEVGEAHQEYQAASESEA